jgi:hypothetical protein
MTVLKKYKYFILSLTLVFGFYNDIIGQKLDNSSELIKTYKAYRIVQQKKTIWIDTIDNWTGKFHKIMSNISDTLGKPIYSKKDIINLLGQPDEIISKSTIKTTNELYYLINKKSDAKISKREVYLIYKWRGLRDFLYFYTKNNKVERSGWYYSWE